MPASTPILGLPYPLASDLVRNGAADIQSLATRVEAVGGRSLGYAQVVADQSGITAGADLTGLTLTVTTVANQRIRITGQVMVSSTANGDLAQLTFAEASTVLMNSNWIVGPSPVSQMYAVVLKPTAGSHTYRLGLARVGGSGSLVLKATPTFPSWILVESLGV